MTDAIPLVFTQDQARAVIRTVLQFTLSETTQVELVHTARQVTRVANTRVLLDDTGDILRLVLTTTQGLKVGVVLETNQVDKATLRAAVLRAEAAVRAEPGSSINVNPTPLGPQRYLPVTLWREGTTIAMRECTDVASSMIDAVRSRTLAAAGFVGLMARSALVMNTTGLESYYTETDCECAMAARTMDGKTSGWYGQAHRDWTRIDPRSIAMTAAEIAHRAVNPQALEPGRYTTILSPFAVGQLVRAMAPAFDAFATDKGMTPFSRVPQGNRLGQRVFDARITLSSDPADPDGGYRPDFNGGLAQPAMTWVKDGILLNLAYSPYYAMAKGKPYAGLPWSIRMNGGTTEVETMIASCDTGLYVNRLSNISVLDPRTGMFTGVTRDGCFQIKHGKIVRPVKNLRFTDSPWFFLNRLIDLGPTQRVAFGYTPPADEGNAEETNWPLRPIIVPPVMVRDFNFTQLAEAV